MDEMILFAAFWAAINRLESGCRNCTGRVYVWDLYS
jgi:hypothetical protein